jgi:hypothetical protein
MFHNSIVGILFVGVVHKEQGTKFWVIFVIRGKKNLVHVCMCDLRSR